eukprot:574919-Rhodomonas_salina.1
MPGPMYSTRSCICLRGCTTIPSSNALYGRTYLLTRCYAMSGTDAAYGATRGVSERDRYLSFCT